MLNALLALQGDNVTTYTVRVVGADGSVGQGCTVCTTSPCLYVHQVTHKAVYYNISVTSIYQDANFGLQNSTTLGEWKHPLEGVNVSHGHSIYQLVDRLRIETCVSKVPAWILNPWFQVGFIED